MCMASSRRSQRSGPSGSGRVSCKSARPSARQSPQQSAKSAQTEKNQSVEQPDPQARPKKRPQSVREAAQRAARASGGQKGPSSEVIDQDKPLLQKAAQQKVVAQKRAQEKIRLEQQAQLQVQKQDEKKAAQKRAQTKKAQAPQQAASEVKNSSSQRAPSGGKSDKESKHPSSVVVAPRSSARISARAGVQKSSQTPILIACILAAALAVGAFFLTQGEEARKELHILTGRYQSAHDSLVASLRSDSLDRAEKYYVDAEKAIAAIEAYVAAHGENLEERPDTQKQQLAIDTLKQTFPLIAKKKAVRKAGSRLQLSLNQVKRLHDLDGLLHDIDSFIKEPLPSDPDLSSDDVTVLLKEVGYLNDAEKTVAAERKRRQQRIVLPSYEVDNRNDLQKRDERRGHTLFAKNIKDILKKNKFGAAYITALHFNKKYPTCNIDDEWKLIEEKEERVWSEYSVMCKTGIDEGTQAALASAQSVLREFIDGEGKEKYIVQARILLQSCDKKLKALAP